MMYRAAFALLVLCAHAVAQPGQGAASTQPATATQPAESPADRISLRAIRVTEIRHAALAGRKGAGTALPVEALEGLHVRLECTGRPVARATDIGGYRLEGRDDRERPVLLHPEGPNVGEKLERIDRRAMFAPNPPPRNRIWVDLLLTNPSRDATALDLNGSFELQLARKERVHVKDLEPGPIEHEHLAAAGLRVEIERVGGVYLVLKLSGNIARLDETQIFSASRQEIGLNSVRNQTEDALRITYELAGAIEGGSVRLVVEVPSGAVTVPVQIEKLPLP